MGQKKVHAEFVPSSDDHSDLSIQETPPEVISALHSIYPFLVAANRILSFITWTTESYYRNFVLLSIYVLSVLHWNQYIIIALPTIIILVFCCLTWFIKTTFIDTTSPNKIPPTIEEIINTLDNFNMRSKFFFQLDSKQRNLKTLLINLSLLTPFYVFLMKNYVPTKVYIACFTIYPMIYYCTWFIALRRLLFRLKIVKQILEFFTGENYSILDNEIEVVLLNLNTKTTIDKNTKIIEFKILENERRWFGLGWTKRMLFMERSPYCTTDFKHSFNNIQDFQFPKLKNYENSKWVWIDKDWIPGSEGWTYYDNYWAHPQPEDSVTKYTRSRQLHRNCLVVLEK